MMRATHICLLSVLLVGLYASAEANDWNEAGGGNDWNEGGSGNDWGDKELMKMKKYITIYGKITWKGQPVKGARVYAYDKKMGRNVLLGHAYTNRMGQYRIRYNLEQHHKKHKQYPDVFIVVEYKKKKYQSRVYYNVKDDVKIDLRLR